MAKVKIIIFALCLILTSCEMETSDNGKLDGFWHMTRLESLSTGSVTNLSQLHRFWSVEFRLMKLQDIGDGIAQSFYVRFTLNNNQLRLYEFRDATHGNSAGETLDELIYDSTVLAPYGINALDITFNVEKLTSNKMVLVNDDVRLSFTKL